MNDHKDITLMKILLSIDCQVLKTGYNYVEVNYFLCSCDDENINPICAGCADKCHKNHKKTPCPKGKQVCSCGLNNHKLNLEEKSNDKSIMNCIFSELSSGLNKHFFPKNNTIFCLYCSEFCKGNQKNFQINLNSKKVPKCECKQHTEKKTIYKNLNIYASNNINLEGLEGLRFFNLILENEKCFDTLYKEFIEIHNNLNEELKINKNNDNYELSIDLASGNYFESVQNFANFAKNTKFFNYFGKKLSEFFDSNFVFNFLNCRFETSNKNLWILKNNAIIIYRKILIHKLFNFCPFLKIGDIQNFNPLQRLLIISNVNENKAVLEFINDTNLNYINSIIMLINKFIEIKDNIHELAYEILRNLFSLCKVFAKFNLFKPKDIDKFCETNDKLIFYFSKLNLNKPNFIENRRILCIGII